jgi:hypothetical protein
MTREEVLTILSEERSYQERKWGDSGRNKPAECYMVYMKDYLDRAFHDITNGGRGYEEALADLRKVAAIAIACFEDNGVPRRK